MKNKPTQEQFALVADYIERDSHPGLSDCDELLDAVDVIRRYMKRCPKCRSYNIADRSDVKGDHLPFLCRDCEHTWERNNMHTKPMEESEGNFQDDEQWPQLKCQKCGEIGGVTCKPWESSCGGYTDYKYTCTKCGKSWWIDGIDS